MYTFILKLGAKEKILLCVIAKVLSEKIEIILTPQKKNLQLIRDINTLEEACKMQMFLLGLSKGNMFNTRNAFINDKKSNSFCHGKSSTRNRI